MGTALLCPLDAMSSRRAVLLNSAPSSHPSNKSYHPTKTRVLALLSVRHSTLDRLSPSLSFQSLPHSFALGNFPSPVFSTASALFCENTRVVGGCIPSPGQPVIPFRTYLLCLSLLRKTGGVPTFFPFWNRASDKDASPACPERSRRERAQRVEGSLFSALLGLACHSPLSFPFFHGSPNTGHETRARCALRASAPTSHQPRITSHRWCIVSS